MGTHINLTTVKTKNIECIIGQEEFECIEDFDRENLVLISITNPNENFIDSTFTSGYKNKLEVQFVDIRKYHEDTNHLIITDEMAKTIKDFIIDNKNEKFVIHCTAGISRSAAVGCAIEYFCDNNQNIEDFWKITSEVKKHWRYSPNIIVFNKICGTELPIKYEE
jgi:predicted protein tyrosine phosphatase